MSIDRPEVHDELNHSTFKVNGDIEVLKGSFTSRSFKPHFHDTYALILVESGIADYSYKKNEYVVEHNRLLVLNPFEVHTGRSLGEGVWNFRSMYIPQIIVNNNLEIGDTEPKFLKQILDHPDVLVRFQLLHHKLMNQSKPQKS